MWPYFTFMWQDSYVENHKGYVHFTLRYLNIMWKLNELLIMLLLIIQILHVNICYTVLFKEEVYKMFWLHETIIIRL